MRKLILVSLTLLLLCGAAVGQGFAEAKTLQFPKDDPQFTFTFPAIGVGDHRCGELSLPAEGTGIRDQHLPLR